MNDAATVGHIVAGKISEAVWGSKDFKHAINNIKLRDDSNTVESRNAKVLRTLQAKGLI